MTSNATQVKKQLYHGLIPAVPIPFTADRTIDIKSQERYATYMSTQPIAGVAVWVHTGRGLKLTQEERELVLTSWRRALNDKIIIAGVGGVHDAQSDGDYIRSAVNMAEHAKSLGADAFLCYAPTRFRDYKSDSALVEYHRAIAEVGLPMMLFYLYEAAGGISYTIETLRKLFALPEVFGIKMATLDSVMTYQDVANLLRSEFPEQLFVTGEDRFLGYSVMHGAAAALIGMASAYPALQQQMMAFFFNNDHTRFIKLSQAIDQLAEATFIPPMEGYIGRMLYILAEQGIIGHEAIHDPWGPIITEAEKEDIRSTMRFLDTLV